MSHRSSLGYFTPAGFHFYLPAFLIASLLHFNEVDLLSDNILYILALAEPNKEKRFIEKVIGEFSTKEKEVILGFLESYTDLFPESNVSLLDYNKTELQRAITYRENSNTVRIKKYANRVFISCLTALTSIKPALHSTSHSSYEQKLWQLLREDLD